jgi:hypothetical protein
MKPAEFLREHGSEIALYDHMTAAIAKCASVDEVKEIRDKAKALELYAAQAINEELEFNCAAIRMRAERRVGQMLKETRDEGLRAMGKDNRPFQESDDPTLEKPTLAKLGISKQQSSDWQKVAEVPEEQFEARLADKSKGKPTTAEFVKSTVPEPPPNRVPDDVLYAWGRIKDFERAGLLEKDPGEVFRAMSNTMQEDVQRIVPLLIEWLGGLHGEAEEDSGAVLRIPPHPSGAGRDDRNALTTLKGR